MIFIIPIITGLKPYEDFEFIKLTSVWRRRENAVHLEDCLFFNFGYDKELPYAEIDLKLEEDIEINVKTSGMEAPSGCSIVLIAGKYVKQVDAVMRRVGDIAEQTQFVPLVAFVFDDHAMIDVSARFIDELH